MSMRGGLARRRFVPVFAAVMGESVLLVIILHAIEVEIIGIKPPQVVNGFNQDPIDGVSFVSTFADSKAPEVKKTQYFDNNGSRGIYQDGWYACTFGPLVPWLPGAPALADWDANKDKWELYNLSTDFSQADDLAEKEPQRLAELQKAFDTQAKENKVYPLGAGIWLRLHPEDRIKTPYRSWTFDATTTRMPDFTAPGIGRESSLVTVEAEFGDKATGVLFALGGSSGGVTLFMDQGRLNYQYNMTIIERYKAQTEAIPAAGRSDKKSGANGAKISKLWGGLMGGDAHLMAGFCQEMIVFGAAFFSARFVAIGAVGHMIGGDNFEH